MTRYRTLPLPDFPPPPESPPLPGSRRPIIDTSCECDRCTSRTAEKYDVAGRCLNCGARFIVRNRKGDRPPLAVDCPSCEVCGYSWRAT